MTLVKAAHVSYQPSQPPRSPSSLQAASHYCPVSLASKEDALMCA
jgi:hypothetical protein